MVGVPRVLFRGEAELGPRLQVRPVRYLTGMGADGSRGAKPYAQRRVSIVFVRVPRAEWPAVVCGTKREFRAACGKHSALWSVQTPMPAVAYTVSSIGVYDSALMVLEAVWREPLGAISAESLAGEGFASFTEFRRAWIRREKRRFPLLRMTTVDRIRPWTADDVRWMGEVLLERLCGGFLREVRPEASTVSNGGSRVVCGHSEAWISRRLNRCREPHMVHGSRVLDELGAQSHGVAARVRQRGTTRSACRGPIRRSASSGAPHSQAPMPSLSSSPSAGGAYEVPREGSGRVAPTGDTGRCDDARDGSRRHVGVRNDRMIWRGRQKPTASTDPRVIRAERERHVSGGRCRRRGASA